jgi:hypothetical protein
MEIEDFKNKIITNLDELNGKTINAASFVDGFQSVVLGFTDGTCVFFGAIESYGNFQVELVGEPESYLIRDAGVITYQEFEILHKKEEVLRIEAIKNRELDTLKRLKAKYEK